MNIQTMKNRPNVTTVNSSTSAQCKRGGRGPVRALAGAATGWAIGVAVAPVGCGSDGAGAGDGGDGNGDGDGGGARVGAGAGGRGAGNGGGVVGSDAEDGAGASRAAAEAAVPNTSLAASHEAMPSRQTMSLGPIRPCEK